MSYDTALQPLDLELDLEQLERAVAPTLSERFRNRLERGRSWLFDHELDLGIVAILVVIAGAVHMHGMYTSPARFDDEGTYTAYAWAVEYTHRLGHYTYWYAHPPLGWLQLAGWNWLTDAFGRAPYAVAAERQFMVLCKLASVALLYGLALRLRFTRIAAVGAVLLFAISPLAVYFTRTALLDNIVTPWLLAGFYLAASPRRSLGAAAGAATCFAVAVLSKETALLFLPALALLFWQCSDRRNRKFGVTVFFSVMALILLVYPAYALIKKELLAGPGHVSLQYAVTWQLFDRKGSGSIFDPKSTAHNVVHTWLVLDPWLPKLALATLVPGLVCRRTRAISLAFAVQVVELLRSGYLPYPFVVAMIPFAILTGVGVLDLWWQSSRVRLPGRLMAVPALAWLVKDRPSRRSVLATERGRLAQRLGSRIKRTIQQRILRRSPRIMPGIHVLSERARVPSRIAIRAGVLAVVSALLVAIWGPWTASIRDLWYDNRDAGKANALAWVESNVEPGRRLVIDDSLWVDLVRHGYPRDSVIWFTKLDVDSAVKLPGPYGWRSIDYVVLDYQDQMSIHLTLDGKPSHDTLSQFPTLGEAIKYSQVVGRFGAGIDQVTVWRVLPELPDAQRAAAAKKAAAARLAKARAAAAKARAARAGAAKARATKAGAAKVRARMAQPHGAR
jgi:hypothetical protein